MNVDRRANTPQRLHLQPGDALLVVDVQNGALGASPDLAASRKPAHEELARLPDPLRNLVLVAAYPVEVSEALRSLARAADRGDRHPVLSRLPLPVSPGT